MNLEKTVCYCLNITNGMVKDAVDAGANTLEEVQEATGAGTVCGSCLENIQHLVEEFLSKKEQLIYIFKLHESDYMTIVFSVAI